MARSIRSTALTAVMQTVAGTPVVPTPSSNSDPRAQGR